MAVTFRELPEAAKGMRPSGCCVIIFLLLPNHSTAGNARGYVFAQAVLIAAFDHALATLLATVATKTGACFNIDPRPVTMAANGDARVVARPNRATVVAALTIALSVAGCADDNARWFAKNPFTPPSGYSYSSLGQTRQDRPITQNDLIDASGACPNYAPAAPSASANPGDGAPPSPDTAALLSGGVALGMSECDVVARLGQPTAVNPGANPNGTRSLVLTYQTGPRPGVYRFEGGRLSEMDRVEAPPAAPEKKTTKKKPATSSGQPKTGDKS